MLILSAKRTKPIVDRNTGLVMFQHCRLVRRFALFVAIGVPLILTPVVLFSPPKNAADRLAVKELYVLPTLMGALFLWEAMRFAVVASADGLYRRSAWGRSRFLRWIEISRFSYRSGWFEIRTAQHVTVVVPYIVGGIDDFLDVCEQRLAPGVIVNVSAGYKLLNRRLPES
jgi:hypothetical protein